MISGRITTTLQLLFTGLIGAGAGAAHAMVGAIDITKEARTCVEEELRARTVRIGGDRSVCSGVLINAHETRTAGHCFVNAKSASWVRDVTGKALAGDNVVRRVGGNNWSATFDRPDQAEVRFTAAVAPVTPIEAADLETLPPGAMVVVAGYGMTRPKRPVLKTLWKNVSHLKYFYGTLKVFSWPRAVAGARAFEITPINPSSSIGLGDSGAPAFVVDGCRLKFLGTVVGRRLGFTGPTRVYVRPHSDLP